MTTSSTPSQDEQPRDAAYWAQQISTLKVSVAPTGALNLNVAGRQLVGPLQGFGQLWQKTYRVRLNGAAVTPAEVIKTWKEHFPEFWPKGEHFYAPRTGIAPGQVALINLVLGPGNAPLGVPLSTGIMVLYADDESFTFMNPQGHMFAGWITFSAHEEDGCTVAQAQVLVRANDPIYEVACRLGASKIEDAFWLHTLQSLAAHFGVDEPVQTHQLCVDPKLQWSQFRNVWYNAMMRTVIYKMLAPVHWVRKQVQR